MLAIANFSVVTLVFMGVLLSGLGAFFVARKTNPDGQVHTSEAAKLWEESTKMRHELREQVSALQAEIQRLKAEIIIWRAKVTELEVTLTQLNGMVQRLEKPSNG